MAYHPTVVSFHKLYHILRLSVPEENMATVAATDHKLTARAVKVHPFHWKTHIIKVLT